MGTPTATVFVDYSGTPHTFIKLDDGNGSVKFYGFAPQKPGSMMGAGTVGQDVTTHFKGDPQNKYAGYMDDVVWSKTIPLTSSQLTAMQGKVSEWIANKPDYNVFGTNCTAFVKDVLTAGGSGYAGITAGPNPLNLIPNSEQGPLFTTDINSGVKTLSDAVRNPSTTPGTPAYEYKQAHPEQFGPVTPTPSAKDPISYDLHQNTDGTWVQKVTFANGSNETAVSDNSSDGYTCRRTDFSTDVNNKLVTTVSEFRTSFDSELANKEVVGKDAANATVTDHVDYKVGSGVTVATAASTSATATQSKVADHWVDTVGSANHTTYKDLDGDGDWDTLLGWGTGIVANLSHADINLANGVTATITGTDNAIHGSTNNVLTVNGSHNTTAVYGNSSVNDFGQGDKLALLGNSSAANVTGDYSLAYSLGDGSSIALAGNHQTSVLYGTWSSSVSTGNGNLVALEGVGHNTAVVSGSWSSTYSEGNGDTLALIAGTHNSASAYGSWTNTYSTGYADVLNLYGSSNYATLYGDGGAVFSAASGHGEVITLLGDNEFVSVAGNWCTVASDAGSAADSVYLGGQHNLAVLNGAWSDVYCSGFGETVYLEGYHDSATVVNGGSADRIYADGVGEVIKAPYWDVIATINSDDYYTNSIPAGIPYPPAAPSYSPPVFPEYDGTDFD